jgi:hypothetical protein
MSKAYCYASGQIDFVSRGEVPAGAIHFASGPKVKLVPFVEVMARHAYDGETLLVPGVPEAPSQAAALLALRKWCNWIATASPAGVNVL